MKLTYRGVDYETNSAQAQTAAPVPVTDLHYRGTTYRLNQAAPTDALGAIFKSRDAKPSSVSATNLHYRGATYRLNQLAQTETLEAVLKHRDVPSVSQKTQDTSQALVLTIDDQARALNTSHHRSVKNRQQVMLSRTAASVGLTGTVAHYWNHIQGQVHPTFSVNYDRSHATFS